MTEHGLPTIETARLRLRPFRPDDVDAYHAAILSDAAVMRYLPGGAPRDRDAAEQQIARFVGYPAVHGIGLWAVERRDVGDLIGHAGLMFLARGSESTPEPPFDPPLVELAYALAQPTWGQGLAPEAGHAALRFGFEHRQLARIVAVFAPGNTASERVMIKLGMTHQGTLHAYGTDLPCYAITRDAFQPGAAPFRVLPAD